MSGSLLLDLPIDVLLKMHRMFCLYDQLNLRKTSKALRRFIDSEPLSYRKILCEVSCCHVSIIFNYRKVIYSNIDIDFPYEGIDHEELSYVKCDDYLERALGDLCSAFENPKIHLKELELKAYQLSSGTPKRLKNLKFIYTGLSKKFKTLHHKIPVEEFSMTADKQNTVLKILPYFTPSSIDISKYGKYLGSFDKVCKLDQWKNSKEVLILNPVKIPVERLACLREFDVKLDPVSGEILKDDSQFPI
ncbi:hypothetical protein CAEBREN_03554 [Caenorhabditis brenneri]|uniref:F-box domain-containing protein n=1 Tax=Caenorhabditis brenneri TaxID=135651 RepID=G0P5S5_CAEBE|nr:hypothetical protein CAEBREN_03554 [Caenorhabditis brenneri]